jgi:hypothetical protein
MIPGVVISGKKFAGKDELFLHFERVVDRMTVLHRWATSLRMDCVEMMAAVGVSITFNDLVDRGKKEMFVGLLQWYGTDFRRREDPDYWVHRGMQEIDKWRQIPRYQDAFVVNTDTRFSNEVLIPKQKGFISIRLEVSPENQRQRAACLGLELTEAHRLHSSELALDKFTQFDAVIDTNCPIEEVWRNADEVLRRYGMEIT